MSQGTPRVQWRGRTAYVGHLRIRATTTGVVVLAERTGRYGELALIFGPDMARALAEALREAADRADRLANPSKRTKTREKRSDGWYCPACGAPVGEGWLFCVRCGARVKQK